MINGKNDLKTFQTDLQSVNSKIKTFLSKYYSDEEIPFDLDTDPNSRQLSNEYSNVLNHLVEASFKVDYLNKPILDQGILSYQEDSDRYIFLGNDQEIEIHAGFPIEVLITDYFDNTFWQKTSIEYSHQPGDNHSHGWYLVASKKTPLEGLEARNRLIK